MFQRLSTTNKFSLFSLEPLGIFENQAKKLASIRNERQAKLKQWKRPFYWLTVSC